MVKRLPIGSAPGHAFAANRRLTMAIGCVPRTSCASTSRPAAISMPSAAKNPGETAWRYTRMPRAAVSVSVPSGLTIVALEPPLNGASVATAACATARTGAALAARDASAVRGARPRRHARGEIGRRARQVVGGVFLRQREAQCRRAIGAEADADAVQAQEAAHDHARADPQTQTQLPLRA